MTYRTADFLFRLATSFGFVGALFGASPNPISLSADVVPMAPALREQLDILLGESTENKMKRELARRYSPAAIADGNKQVTAKMKLARLSWNSVVRNEPVSFTLKANSAETLSALRNGNAAIAIVRSDLLDKLPSDEKRNLCVLAKGTRPAGGAVLLRRKGDSQNFGSAERMSANARKELVRALTGKRVLAQTGRVAPETYDDLRAIGVPIGGAGAVTRPAKPWPSLDPAESLHDLKDRKGVDAVVISPRTWALYRKHYGHVARFFSVVAQSGDAITVMRNKEAVPFGKWSDPAFAKKMGKYRVAARFEVGESRNRSAFEGQVAQSGTPATFPGPGYPPGEETGEDVVTALAQGNGADFALITEDTWKSMQGDGLSRHVEVALRMPAAPGPVVLCNRNLLRPAQIEDYRKAFAAAEQRSSAMPLTVGSFLGIPLKGFETPPSARDRDVATLGSGPSRRSMVRSH